jgi:hypothetical protein
VKRLLFTVVVVLALLTVADRIAVRVASSRVADEVQSSQHLAAAPTVSIHGFPFLTQAFNGRYDDIEVTSRGLVRGRIVASSVTASLRGVRLALGDALGGSLPAVPVDRARLTATLAWDALENASGEPVRLSAARGGGVHVVTTVSGRTFGFTSDPAVERGELVLVPRDVAGRTIRFGVPALPFGLRLAGVRVLPAGLQISAVGSRVTLG